jgi:LytS/YehU family sensor histidine kinase
MKGHFYDYLLSQLNGISRIAVMENASTTQKEVIRLSEYIRYKYSRKEEIVKLEDELVVVHQLIKLYQTRLGNQLSYEEEIPECAKDIYLPHYAVLTFIENSLYHAFQTKAGIWEIGVSVEKDGENFLLTIQDNGEGFEGFDKIISGEVRDSSIYSVLQRLSPNPHLEQDLIKIESSQLGTKIQLRLKK